MAQINLTLTQDEILQLLSTNRDEAFKTLFQDALNAVLKAESSDQLKAEPYERTEERTDSRNGFRERSLTTRIGTITLNVPRHRNEPFKSMVFEHYSRSETALILSMAEMVVNGVSTRRVSKVIETLCGAAPSKSAVSDACKELDVAVREFRDRPILGDHPFITVDATYFKVREDHRVISKALMLAYSINQKGQREIIGYGIYDRETLINWTDFLQRLKDRGLEDPAMITSDAHEGIIGAVAKIFPKTVWQRCQFHFTKNITEQTPKKYQEGLRQELQEMYNCSTIQEARKKRDSILSDYSDVAEKAMACLDNGFESVMSVMNLPVSLRKLCRTSNHIERLNKELKRRSNVIGIFPNVDSLNRLIGSVLMERNELLTATTNRGKLLPKSIYQELQLIRPQLEEFAVEQHQFLAA